jgi:hypothetical protein
MSYIKREKQFILQIFLSDIGSSTIRNKYSEKLKRLRKEKKAIAVISFMISDTDFKKKVLSDDEKE